MWEDSTLICVYVGRVTLKNFSSVFSSYAAALFQSEINMNYPSEEPVYTKLNVLEKVWPNSAFSDLMPSKQVLNCLGSRRGAQCDSQVDRHWSKTANDLKH